MSCEKLENCHHLPEQEYNYEIQSGSIEFELFANRSFRLHETQKYVLLLTAGNFQQIFRRLIPKIVPVELNLKNSITIVFEGTLTALNTFQVITVNVSWVTRFSFIDFFLL